MPKGFDSARAGFALGLVTRPVAQRRPLTAHRRATAERWSGVPGQRAQAGATRIGWYPFFLAMLRKLDPFDSSCSCRSAANMPEQKRHFCPSLSFSHITADRLKPTSGEKSDMQ